MKLGYTYNLPYGYGCLDSAGYAQKGGVASPHSERRHSRPLTLSRLERWVYNKTKITFTEKLISVRNKSGSEKYSAIDQQTQSYRRHNELSKEAVSKFAFLSCFFAANITIARTAKPQLNGYTRPTYE